MPRITPPKSGRGLLQGTPGYDAETIARLEGYLCGVLDQAAVSRGPRPVAPPTTHRTPRQSDDAGWCFACSAPTRGLIADMWVCDECAMRALEVLMAHRA